jgi:hypothetical protein
VYTRNRAFDENSRNDNHNQGKVTELKNVTDLEWAVVDHGDVRQVLRKLEAGSQVEGDYQLRITKEEN